MTAHSAQSMHSAPCGQRGLHSRAHTPLLGGVCVLRTLHGCASEHPSESVVGRRCREISRHA